MKRLSLGLMALLVLSACKQSKEAHFNGYAQGTTFSISYLYEGRLYTHVQFDSVEARLDGTFRAIDKALSTYVDDSQISRINRGDTLSTDHHFTAVHAKSLEVWKESAGYFDPTVGKLVRFWGFGPDARRAVDTNIVDSILNYVGLEKLAPMSAQWSIPLGMELDYNAIAQGYTVDALAEMLQASGIRDYMVEVGGEVRCLGSNMEGKPWRIGVDKPIENIDEQDRFQFILGMDSLALATSGNYRKFWVDTATGIRYAHTINTKTGYPAKNRLLSASVLAGTAMEADAYATAFMSMGLQKSLKFLENSDKNLEVYLIYSKAGEEDWQVYLSDGFKERILN